MVETNMRTCWHCLRYIKHREVATGFKHRYLAIGCISDDCKSCMVKIFEPLIW